MSKDEIITTNNSFVFKLLNGKEPFLCDGKPQGFCIEDFWSFQFSNIWDMVEEIAEFLVAKALGLTMPQNKNGWTLYDMKYRDKRIEVKTTTYYHPWRPDGEYSEDRRFGITKAYSKYKDNTSSFERQNDVYVFCITTGRETQESADPSNLDNWRFYVVPTSKINSVCKDGKHVGLGRVKKLSGTEDGVMFKELKATIDNVIDSNNNNPITQ